MKDKKKIVVVFQAWNFRNLRKKDTQNRFLGEISKLKKNENQNSYSHNREAFRTV